MRIKGRKGSENTILQRQLQKINRSARFTELLPIELEQHERADGNFLVSDASQWFQGLAMKKKRGSWYLFASFQRLHNFSNL